jgi:hypothetical protein
MPSKVYIFDNLDPSDVGALLQVQADSSVVPVQVAYITDTSTDTLLNKTFDANGLGNNLSNVETHNFAAGTVITDVTFTGVTNTQLASALAIKTYVDNQLGISDVLTYKGSVDASANPDFPAGAVGDFYRVSIAGRIGGLLGEVVRKEDIFYCIQDNAGGNFASVGTSWGYLQGNISSATVTEEGLVQLADIADAEAKTSSTLALTPVSVSNFPVKKTFTIGDNSDTSYSLTHNLNTKNLVVSARSTSTDEQVNVEVVCTTANSVNVNFATAPTLNSITVTIIG